MGRHNGRRGTGDGDDDYHQHIQLLGCWSSWLLVIIIIIVVVEESLLDLPRALIPKLKIGPVRVSRVLPARVQITVCAVHGAQQPPHTRLVADAERLETDQTEVLDDLRHGGAEGAVLGRDVGSLKELKKVVEVLAVRVEIQGGI